jgi:hypothetical protein
MLLRATVKLRQALIDEGTGTQLERLVVEQVVSSHLQQAFHESREAESASKLGEVSKDRVEAMERTAGRHVKALGALATLRSMMPRLAEEDHHRSTTPIGESSEAEVEKIDHLGVNRLLGCFKDQAHASVTN